MFKYAEMCFETQDYEQAAKLFQEIFNLDIEYKRDQVLPYLGDCYYKMEKY